MSFSIRSQVAGAAGKGRQRQAQKRKMKAAVQPDSKVAQATSSNLPARTRISREEALAPDGRLAQLAAMMNGSPGPKALAQLKEDIQRTPQSDSIPAERVIQCLMAGTTFLGRYKTLDATRLKIGKLLTDYGSAWGLGYGTYFGEYDGKVRRQQRIQILAKLDQRIHEHFRDSGTERIKDAPESNLMLELLDEVQVEHEKQIKELLAYKNELPVSDKNLSSKEKAKVLKTWQSVVGGTGNLQITEKEKNKETGLKREHAGFRVKALSSVARLLQGPEGRKVIKEANKDGSNKAQHITIAPVSNKAHDVYQGEGNKRTKSTIPPGIWDAEALKQSKGSITKGDRFTTGTFWNLDADNDPIGTYELAARHHETKGKPDGVIILREKYLFNEGTGSTVRYISEHKDSENRVMTNKGNKWREGLAPTSVALGHELGHAVRTRKGASVSGITPGFFELTGIHPEKQGYWSGNEEELVNITEVENRLLPEKGLNPRIFHTGYEESLQETGLLRLKRYHDASKTFDNEKYSDIYELIKGKKLDLADQLLNDEGF